MAENKCPCHFEQADVAVGSYVEARVAVHLQGRKERHAKFPIDNKDIQDSVVNFGLLRWFSGLLIDITKLDE